MDHEGVEEVVSIEAAEVGLVVAIIRIEVVVIIHVQEVITKVEATDSDEKMMETVKEDIVREVIIRVEAMDSVGILIAGTVHEEKIRVEDMANVVMMATEMEVTDQEETMTINKVRVADIIVVADTEARIGDMEMVTEVRAMIIAAMAITIAAMAAATTVWRSVGMTGMRSGMPCRVIRVAAKRSC